VKRRIGMCDMGADWEQGDYFGRPEI